MAPEADAENITPINPVAPQQQHITNEQDPLISTQKPVPVQVDDQLNQSEDMRLPRQFPKALGPKMVPGEPACGTQTSSLRPSSAKYSFPRKARDFEDQPSKMELPGPGDYDVSYAAVLSQAGAFMGKGPKTAFDRHEYQYPDVDTYLDVEVAEALRYKTPPCAVFGTERRGKQYHDLSLLKLCPESAYLRAGPGFVYQPDDRKAGGRTRPRSAPSWSMRPRGESKLSENDVPANQAKAPAHYNPKDASLGKQVNSKRKTGRASSFGRAGRFPAPKQSQGDVTAECNMVDSCFGTSGKHKKRAPVATFGMATREGRSRTMSCSGAGDRIASAKMGPAQMYHPTLPPRHDVLRYHVACR